jgi:hypothetical protein
MFQVVVIKSQSPTSIKSFEEAEEAYVELDRLVSFVEADSDISVALMQDDRPVKIFTDGEWLFPSRPSIYL